MARQALTLTGAFVGAAYGAPQLGFFLGSLVGNAVDPVRIKAPSIGDISQQTSAEGVACPLYAGTAGGAGNLVYCSEPDIVDGGTSSGKGGPEVENPDRAYVTFIIRVGASLFDGPGYRMGITSLIKVWEDDKLVYDVSPTSQILAESAKYAETFTFYPGNYTQLPDPDVEAIKGVGNVPAYRGRAIFVKKRYDMTDRKAVPNYRFEVSVDGVPMAPVALVTDVKSYGGSPASLQVGAANIGFAPQTNYVRVSPNGLYAVGVIHSSTGVDRFKIAKFDAETESWSLLPNPADMPPYAVSSCAWSANSQYLYVAINPTNSNAQSIWVYQRSGDTFTKVFDTGLSPPNSAPIFGMDLSRDGSTLAVLNANTGDNLYIFDVAGSVLSNARSYGAPSPGSPGSTGRRVAMHPSSARVAYGTQTTVEVYRTDTDPLQNLDWIFVRSLHGLFWTADGQYLIAVGDNVAGNQAVLTVIEWDEVTDTLSVVSTLTLAGVIAPIDSAITDDGRYIAVAVSETAPRMVSVSAAAPPVLAEISAPSGTGAAVTSVSWASTTNVQQVQAGYTTFEQVVLATGRRCRMPDSVWNLPGLDAKVIRGTVVASQGYTGQDFLNSLRTVFPCDGACFDGKIHILLRGGEIDLELDDEFRVEEESDLEQEEVLRNGDEKRQANLRRPARINVMFPNANVGYNLTKAMPPAFGDRGDAVGETSLQVPVVLDETTEAAQLADVLDKISRADAEAEIVRVWPEYLAAKLVPGSRVRLTSGGLSRRTRVENIRRGDGTVRVLSRIDRAHAYGSLATAQPSPGWPQPPPSLVGDTTAIFLNLPALVDDQDRLGVVAAISGDAGTAWHGARIEWRVQGTTAWTTLGTYTARAVLGTLLEDLPGASPYWPDWTNEVRVRLLQDDQIESLTDTEWLSEMGAFAIRRADGTAEIIQARDAVNDSGQDWTLTMLQRGRLDTDSATGHSAGAQVVFLDNSLFLPLPISAIGQTLEFRVTSLGASPETAPTFTLAWDPAISQREWSPMGLELTRAGGTISGSFSPRHRFGTDVVPVPSGNVLGYRVTLTDGTTTQVLPDTTATTFSTSDAAFSGPITVTVQTLNRYTGPGPGTSETL